jgi:hypothetical protein
MLPLILVGIGLVALGVAEVALRKKEKTPAQNPPAVKGEDARVDIAKDVPTGGDSDTSANPAPDDGAPPTQ